MASKRAQHSVRVRLVVLTSNAEHAAVRLAVGLIIRIGVQLRRPRKRVEERLEGRGVGRHQEQLRHPRRRPRRRPAGAARRGTAPGTSAHRASRRAGPRASPAIRSRARRSQSTRRLVTRSRPAPQGVLSPSCGAAVMRTSSSVYKSSSSAAMLVAPLLRGCSGEVNEAMLVSSGSFMRDCL